VGAFWCNFRHFGLHFRTPGGIWASQWCSEGRLRSFFGFCVQFGGPCWPPFGIDFGLFFLLILGSVLGAIPGRLRWILEQFWLNIGSIFGVFWGPLEKVKIELPCKQEPHFHCPKGPKNQCFFDILSKRPPEHPWSLFWGPWVDLGSIWGSLGDPIFHDFSHLFSRSPWSRFRPGSAYPPPLPPRVRSQGVLTPLPHPPPGDRVDING